MSGFVVIVPRSVVFTTVRAAGGPGVGLHATMARARSARRHRAQEKKVVSLFGDTIPAELPITVPHLRNRSLYGCAGKVRKYLDLQVSESGVDCEVLGGRKP